MPAQIPFDERDARALHRHVRAGAHRDADGRSRERRRVVDPVARHGHHTSLRLETPHEIALAGGQHLGMDVAQWDAERVRNSFGRGAIVARHHDDADTLAPQRLQRAARRLFDPIGDGK